METAYVLRTGISVDEAEEIIQKNYKVLRRGSKYVEIVSIDGFGENYLGVFEEQGRVAFIGLYER